MAIRKGSEYACDKVLQQLVESLIQKTLKLKASLNGSQDIQLLTKDITELRNELENLVKIKVEIFRQESEEVINSAGGKSGGDGEISQDGSGISVDPGK